MKVCEVKPEHVPAYWVADWSHIGECDYSNMAAVIRTHRPMLQIDLVQLLQPRLNEATYQDLMAQIDPNFLQQGLRVQNTYVLPHDGRTYQGPKILRGISYQGFKYDTMKFVVTPSSEYPERSKPAFYDNLIQFVAWDDVGGDPDLTPREKASLLLWSSDIRLHCNDPSFLYWGYQYILSRLDAAIVPETRYPKINNPGLEGVMCKHLNRVLHVLPFYNADIGQAVSDQWGGKIDKKAIEAIRRRADRQRQENELNTQLPPEQEIPSPEALQGEAPETEEPEQENPDETPPTA